MDSHVKFWNDLQQSLITTEELTHKSGSDLADLLLHYEWTELDVFTPQSDLMEEIIRRLAIYDLLLDACLAFSVAHSPDDDQACVDPQDWAEFDAAIAAAQPVTEQAAQPSGITPKSHLR